MKGLFPLLLFMLPVSAFCQVSLNFGLGAIHAGKSHPVFKLSVQGEYRRFVIEAAEFPVLSRKIDPGNYLGFSVGYRIWKLIPTVGYLYNLKSSDAKNKAINGWKWKGGLKFTEMVNYNAGLYMEAVYIDDHPGITVGITYTF